jgi:hypothetical protein
MISSQLSAVSGQLSAFFNVKLYQFLPSLLLTYSDKPTAECHQPKADG